MLRKRYLSMLEDHKLEQSRDFQERLFTLKRLYPPGIKINLKAIENRLKRVSMRIQSFLKPYIKCLKKPINIFTRFSKLSFSLAELKMTHRDSNSNERLATFGRMVERN
jgi:hypothetical protein